MIGALVVLLLRIVVGKFGIDDIESTLDAIAVWCLVIFVPTLWLGSLIEALRVPDWLWGEASQSKPTFVLLVVLLSLLGCVLYLSIARPALHRAVQASVV